MKLTKRNIKLFEQEQKQYGTETALYNMMFVLAAELLKGIGIKSIKTTKRSK